jgi:hypothetical protein
MVLKRPYLRDRLAPRCRLILSWSCRGFQGFGCSPIKKIRELGLERRETVRFLSGVFRKTKNHILVREDWRGRAYGVPVEVVTA